MRRATSPESLRPYLTTLATARTGSDAEVGRYCEVRDLWVIDDEKGSRPLAMMADSIGETATSTATTSEADDIDVGGFELVTSTFVKTEADDFERIAAAHALGTSTKVLAEADDVERIAECRRMATSTRVLAEADDMDAAIAGLLAVTTKTDANVERDDTAIGLDMFEMGFGVPIPPLPVH